MRKAWVFLFKREKKIACINWQYRSILLVFVRISSSSSSGITNADAEATSSTTDDDGRDINIIPNWALNASLNRSRAAVDISLRG